MISTKNTKDSESKKPPPPSLQKQIVRTMVQSFGGSKLANFDRGKVLTPCVCCRVQEKLAPANFACRPWKGDRRLASLSWTRGNTPSSKIPTPPLLVRDLREGAGGGGGAGQPRPPGCGPCWTKQHTHGEGPRRCRPLGLPGGTGGLRKKHNTCRLLF